MLDDENVKDNLLLLNDAKSLQWNYVNRVDLELSQSQSAANVMVNKLLPDSYKEVVMLLSRACNFSRVALLLSEDERYVAFALIVDEDYIPFMLDELVGVVVPCPCVFKVFPDSVVARGGTGDGVVESFLEDVVIPDLNTNFASWKSFWYDGEE